MGFSGIPPRLDQAQAVAAIQLWVTRADAAIWHEDPPWTELLAGLSADSIVAARYLTLAQFYRGHGLTVAFELDPTNGLNRAANHDSLVAHGYGLGMPTVQAAYRRYAAAVDTILAPDYLGLGSEVNLVRAAAPDSIYANEVLMCRVTADSLRALHSRIHIPHASQLYATIQVDVAWGLLGGAGAWQGAATELADVSWADVIGFSSYPYMDGFGDPDLLPDDWFSRPAQQAGKPVMVVEGGWTSASLASAGVVSTPGQHARYVRRMQALLDRAGAIAWFQLTFTDLDLSGWGLPPGSILPLFASLGLVDADLVPKPALAPWDSLFARRRAP